MSRKGESIFKRKDGRWEARYIKERTPEGRAIYGYVYAKSYLEAKKKRYEILKQLGKDSAESKKLIKNKAIFTDLADLWLRSLQPQIKKSTYIKYQNIIHSYIYKGFYNVNVNEISANQLNMFCNNLLLAGGKQHQGLSPKTVVDILSVIRSILSYANLQKIETQCTGKEVVIKQSAAKMYIFSHSEQSILCNYLVDHLSNRNFGILLSLFTGIRIGELCALRWEDISIDEKTIYIHKTMQRLQTQGNSTKKTEVIITSPKSSCSIRTIPIPDNLIFLIKHLSQTNHGYILTGKDTKYVEPRTMQNHLKKILLKAGLQPVKFHSLRHTFATRCIEVGFDIKSLSEILGHANVNITMNRYVHPTMKMKRENMQRLSDLFIVS